MERIVLRQTGEINALRTNGESSMMADESGAETNCLNTVRDCESLLKLWPEYEILHFEESRHQLDLPWYVNSTTVGLLQSCRYPKNDEFCQDGSPSTCCSKTWQQGDLWPEYEVMKIDESRCQLDIPWFVSSTAGGTRRSCQYAEDDRLDQSSSTTSTGSSSCLTPVYGIQSSQALDTTRFQADSFTHQSSDDKENASSSPETVDRFKDKKTNSRISHVRSPLKKSLWDGFANSSSSAASDQRLYPSRQSHSSLSGASVQRLYPSRQSQSHFSDTQGVPTKRRGKHGVYQCEECYKVFSGSSGYKRHMLVHTGHKAFRCPLCDFCFSLKHNMHRHVRSIHRKLK